MAQQTAVEWFYQRILAEDIKAVFEQAKAMEKEQIENAYEKGAEESWDAEKYYNKTYKEPEEPKESPKFYYAGWVGLFQNRTDI
jgi:hypothetical protein